MRWYVQKSFANSKRSVYMLSNLLENKITKSIVAYETAGNDKVSEFP